MDSRRICEMVTASIHACFYTIDSCLWNVWNDGNLCCDRYTRQGRKIMIRFLIIGLKCLVKSLCLILCYLFESIFWMLIGKDYKSVKIPLSRITSKTVDLLWELCEIYLLPGTIIFVVLLMFITIHLIL